MVLGFPAITTQLLQHADADIYLTPSQVSWFASITAITCPFGALLSGFCADKLGRRNTLMLVDVIAIVSFLIIGLSSRVSAEILFFELMLGRAIGGFVLGMTSTPAVMYVAEVCHPKLRGRLTMLSSPFFTAIGLLIIYFLGFLIPVS